MLPKKRRSAFLLLPILILIFVFGWIFYFAGDSKSGTKKARPTKVKHPLKERATPNDLEIGVITERPEEQTIKT